MVGNPNLNPVEGKVKGEGLCRKRFPEVPLGAHLDHPNRDCSREDFHLGRNCQVPVPPLCVSLAGSCLGRVWPLPWTLKAKHQERYLLQALLKEGSRKYHHEYHRG